jgi:hypothetical protein
MNPDEVDAALILWGELYVKNIKSLLKDKLYTYAPGFKGNAYGKGRRPQFAGQANKIATGSLYKSVDYNVNQGILEIYMAPHWSFVNFGVKPRGYKPRPRGQGGNSEFITALVAWYKQRLGLSEEEALPRAFATRINIFKFGIAPTNFLEKAQQKTEGEILETLAPLGEDFINELFTRLGQQ